MLPLSAQTDKKRIELSGTISNKYPIKMILTIQNNKVLGYYFYEKHKTKILVSGILKGTKITLIESPDFDPEFSIGFIGVLKNKNFTGNWIDKNNRKTLDFKATIESHKSLEIDPKITKIEGNYEDVTNSKKFRGSVKLQFINQNIFSFEISNGSENCNGNLKGLIDLKNLKNGIYSDNLCKELKFSIEKDSVFIQEKDCEWHGATCSFDGKYKKQVLEKTNQNSK